KPTDLGSPLRGEVQIRLRCTYVAPFAAQRRACNPRLVRESERRRERDVLDEAEGRMPVAAGRELVMDDACARPGGEDIACAASPPTKATETTRCLPKARQEIRA